MSSSDRIEVDRLIDELRDKQMNLPTIIEERIRFILRQRFPGEEPEDVIARGKNRKKIDEIRKALLKEQSIATKVRLGIMEIVRQNLD